jgi:multidrug resistance protein, MATE family
VSMALPASHAAPAVAVREGWVAQHPAVQHARDVWRLAWPAIAHMLLLTAVFVVDRAIIGRNSDDALASLQISTVLLWTLTGIFTAFSTATLAIAGRAIGSANPSEAARVATTSVVFAAMGGVIVAGVAWVIAPVTLGFAFPNAGAAVMADVSAYLRVALVALPFVFVEAAMAAVLQATGDTKSPLRAALLGNGLNLVVSCCLVFGVAGLPRLGVVGVAIGASLAAVTEVVALSWVLARRGGVIDLRRDGFAWDGALARRLLRVASPAMADKLTYAGGYLAFVALIGWLGPLAMAANQVISSVEAICFLTAEGIGIAAASLVAQRMGAGQRDCAATSLRVSAWLAVAIAAPLGLLFALGAGPLLALFGGSRTVVEFGAAPLVIAGLSQPFMAYATVVRMGLRGAGATESVLAVTLAGTLLVRLPLGYLLAVELGLGLTGIWLACLADWVVEAALLSLVVRRGRWKTALV